MNNESKQDKDSHHSYDENSSQWSSDEGFDSAEDDDAQKEIEPHLSSGVLSNNQNNKNYTTQKKITLKKGMHVRYKVKNDGDNWYSAKLISRSGKATGRLEGGNGWVPQVWQCTTGIGAPQYRCLETNQSCRCGLLRWPPQPSILAWASTASLADSIVFPESDPLFFRVTSPFDPRLKTSLVTLLPSFSTISLCSSTALGIAKMAWLPWGKSTSAVTTMGMESPERGLRASSWQSSSP